jgi:hypothetical protein
VKQIFESTPVSAIIIFLTNDIWLLSIIDPDPSENWLSNKPTKTSKTAVTDWFIRGILSTIGSRVDGFLGRQWSPSSSLATSELVARIQKVLDGEVREVPGKGRVVPHHIQLKVQWNKFSTDSEEALCKLENELLIAAVDHINDNLYYTYSPVEIEIKPDYFIEGVKLHAGFDRFDEAPAELNVTLPAIDVKDAIAQVESTPSIRFEVTARFPIKGVEHAKDLLLTTGQSVSIGRIASSEIVLDDNSVSKTHASLSVGDDGKLLLADTGSTNGTFINNERIAYGKAIDIDEKDLVKFGDVVVTFAVRRTGPGLTTEKMEDPHKADTVEVDGFTFTSREPSRSEKPAEKKGED